MKTWQFPIRYMSLIAVVFSLAGSALMFYIGSAKTVKGFLIYMGKIQLDVEYDKYRHLTQADFAIVSLVESIDAFLLAVVLLIFAYGIFRIFINHKEPDDNNHAGPDWIKINDISQLKIILIEVVVVILFVFFLRLTLVHNIIEASWTFLVLPISILLLSISLYFLKKGHR